jgi:hypothetical protein
VNYFGNPYTPMNNITQPTQMTQQIQQPGSMYARYVAGKEEAVAAQVLPDGNLNVFVDNANGRIYTKAVAPNGAAAFREFAFRQPVQQPTEPQQVQQWAPMEAVEQLRVEVRQLREMFRERGGEQ